MWEKCLIIRLYSFIRKEFPLIISCTAVKRRKHKEPRACRRQPKDEIKILFSSLLELCELTFDTIERLNKIKEDLSLECNWKI